MTTDFFKFTQIYRPPIYRAAIIPYIFNDEGDIEMMFMKPADPNRGGPDWQMAKGHVDLGEEPEQAAIREGEEELGLKSENIISIFHLGRFLKYTDVYCCEVANKTNFGTYEDETGDVIWLTREQFAEIGRDIHQDVVEEAIQQINWQHLQKIMIM